MAVTLDLFEYATDALAQTAYVSSDSGLNYGTDFTSAGMTTAVSSTANGDKANVIDNTSGTWWQASTPLPQWWYVDLGSGVTKTIRKLRHKQLAGGHTARGFTLAGSNNASDWTDIYTGEFSNATGVWDEFTFENATAYRYYRITYSTMWVYTNPSPDEVEMMEATVNLQCYSEATIKQEGSYSLKGIALVTGSLNDTLTRTVSPTIDLSNQSQIKFGIYASRIGSNIKISIHDSGGTTTEKTHAVSTPNAWETDTWDISAVSDVNKDAIDQIKVTIVNADADNTFYIDNMYGEVLGRSFGVIIM